MTESMQRAANTVDGAADTMLRAANIISEATERLDKILGPGWGNPLTQLVEQLLVLNARQAVADLQEPPAPPGVRYTASRQVPTPTPGSQLDGRIFSSGLNPPIRAYAWVDDQGRFIKRAGDVYFAGAFYDDSGRDVPRDWKPLILCDSTAPLWVVSQPDGETRIFFNRAIADEWAGNNPACLVHCFARVAGGGE